MFPFHTWLPAAHVEAPTAGSVVLASVLLKMGTYGFLRFCLPITPYATQVLAPYVLGLSAIAILYGGCTALAQSDLKKLVAYSSVGHMGFATLGIFVLNASGLEGAVLVMINHGVTTGALFICVGIIYERLHTRELAAAAVIGKFMPVFAGFFGVFCLSSLAFPGTNSFIGEFHPAMGRPFVVLWSVSCPASSRRRLHLRMLRVAWAAPTTHRTQGSEWRGSTLTRCWCSFSDRSSPATVRPRHARDRAPSPTGVGGSR